MTKAKIHYYDIGDYLKREEKLAIVRNFGSVSNIPWQILHPNEHGDWISQRNNVFGTFLPLGDRVGNVKFFNQFSGGLQTNRDPWVYNFSNDILQLTVDKLIEHYNSQIIMLEEYCEKKMESADKAVNKIINYDPRFISWTRGLKTDLVNLKKGNKDNGHFCEAIYRPFCKQYVFVSQQFNEYVNKMTKYFPNASLHNYVICLSSRGATEDFSTLVVEKIPNVEFVSRAQCFPLYYYEERPNSSPTLFDPAEENEYIRRDGISDFILKRGQEQYGKNVSKEDIFYYVYGILQSQHYRTAFASDLKKMLPRLPLVEDVRDFWKFSKAGRQLAELHINYEQVPPYPGVLVQGDDSGNFFVEKMRYPSKDRKDTIIYNSRIIISNIPSKAYEYVVNGKSAIEWIMERYQVKTDKASGIKNDPNDWSKEVGNPRYILDLLLSIINVSMQTVEIVEGLPELRFE